MTEILQRGIASQYDRNAGRYDRAARANVLAAERLVQAVPDGIYGRLLDAGCGTGFATSAALARFPGIRHVTGVDISAQMIERMREKLDATGVSHTLHVSDIARMAVPPASVDLAICSMVMHWLTDRPEAVARLGDTLAPGGVLAIVAPGPGHDREYVEVLRGVDPPVLPRMIEVFDAAQVFPDEILGAARVAGLDPVDAWVEERRRCIPPEEYMARITAVGSHLWSHLADAEQEALVARVTDAVRAASGGRGFEYTFTKTFVVARRARNGSGTPRTIDG